MFSLKKGTLEEHIETYISKGGGKFMASVKLNTDE
jgi:hypothetical protein